jgi:hypothetical protein
MDSSITAAGSARCAGHAAVHRGDTSTTGLSADLRARSSRRMRTHSLARRNDDRRPRCLRLAVPAETLRSANRSGPLWGPD